MKCFTAKNSLKTICRKNRPVGNITAQRARQVNTMKIQFALRPLSSCHLFFSNLSFMLFEYSFLSCPSSPVFFFFFSYFAEVTNLNMVPEKTGVDDHPLRGRKGERR